MPPLPTLADLNPPHMVFHQKHLLTIATMATIVITLSAFAPEGEDGLCDSPLVGGHTGAPGESSCTGCHSGTANTGTAEITLTLGDAGTYVPGTQYTGTVTMKRLGREKFGFCCLALQDAGNVNLGGFGLLEAVRTRTFMDGARNYVSHTPCGADAQDSTGWSFTWLAPPTDVGPITIYMANLVANHSHSTSGDETYTQTLTLTPAGVGINDPITGTEGFAIHPNPATDRITVEIPAGRSVTRLRVLDAQGRMLMDRSTNGQRTMNVAVDMLPPGSYSVELLSAEGALHQRFVRE